MAIGRSCSIEYLAPAFRGDAVTARAVERVRAGRSGIDDVEVRRDSDGAVLAELRAISRVLSSRPDRRGKTAAEYRPTIQPPAAPPEGIDRGRSRGRGSARAGLGNESPADSRLTATLIVAVMFATAAVSRGFGHRVATECPVLAAQALGDATPRAKPCHGHAGSSPSGRPQSACRSRWCRVAREPPRCASTRLRIHAPACQSVTVSIRSPRLRSPLDTMHPRREYP
jgi:hypothetical protein